MVRKAGVGPRLGARAGLVLLCVAAALGVTAPVAWAHATTGQLIMAGRPEAVSIVVNAETDAPMTGVDVVVPRGFDLLSTVPAISGGGQHWPVTRAGDVLHYRGAGIPDGGALYIEVMGRAGAAGMLAFDTTTRAADGTVVSWSGPASSSHPAALVQVIGGGPSSAGSRAPTGASTGAGSSTGHPPAILILAAAAALAGLAAAYARRRRAKPVVSSGR